MESTFSGEGPAGRQGDHEADVTGAILEALAPFPEAHQAVVAALMRVGDGAG